MDSERKINLVLEATNRIADISSARGVQLPDGILTPIRGELATMYEVAWKDCEEEKEN